MTAKRPPHISDPALQRVVQEIYGYINELYGAVRKPDQTSPPADREGAPGDLRLVKGNGETYELEGRFRGGWQPIAKAKAASDNPAGGLNSAELLALMEAGPNIDLADTGVGVRIDAPQVFNGNKAITRTSWPTGLNLNAATITEFLRKLFFPFEGARLVLSGVNTTSQPWGNAYSPIFNCAFTLNDETVYQNAVVEYQRVGTTTWTEIEGVWFTPGEPGPMAPRISFYSPTRFRAKAYVGNDNNPQWVYSNVMETVYNNPLPPLWSLGLSHQTQQTWGNSIVPVITPSLTPESYSVLLSSGVEWSANGTTGWTAIANTSFNAGDTTPFNLPVPIKGTTYFRLYAQLQTPALPDGTPSGAPTVFNSAGASILYGNAAPAVVAIGALPKNVVYGTSLTPTIESTLQMRDDEFESDSARIDINSVEHPTWRFSTSPGTQEQDAPAAISSQTSYRLKIRTRRKALTEIPYTGAGAYSSKFSATETVTYAAYLPSLLTVSGITTSGFIYGDPYTPTFNISFTLRQAAGYRNAAIRQFNPVTAAWDYVTTFATGTNQSVPVAEIKESASYRVEVEVDELVGGWTWKQQDFHIVYQFPIHYGISDKAPGDITEADMLAMSRVLVQGRMDRTDIPYFSGSTWMWQYYIYPAVWGDLVWICSMLNPQWKLDGFLGTKTTVVINGQSFHRYNSETITLPNSLYGFYFNSPFAPPQG